MTYKRITSTPSWQPRVHLRHWRNRWEYLLTRTCVVVGVLLGILLSGCSKHAAEDSAGAEPVPDVTVAKVVRTQISNTLMVSGNLAAAPNRDAKIAALVPGRIAAVMAVEGTAVKDGQTLAELDTTLLREQERQAEAAVQQAKASAENARLSVQREESLLQRGISSRKEVEDARTQLAVTTATLNQAEAGLATAKAQVARANVR